MGYKINKRLFQVQEDISGKLDLITGKSLSNKGKISSVFGRLNTGDSNKGRG